MKRIFVLLFILILVLAGCSNNQQKTYYEKGVQAYSSGDYTLAKHYLSRAEGYEDSEVYLDSINEIIGEKNSMTGGSSSMMTESIPTNLSTDSEYKKVTKPATKEIMKTTTEALTRSSTKSATQGTTKATINQTVKPTTKSTAKATTTEQQRTIQYTNATYNGDIVDGKPNGYGEMIWTDGASYEGEWEKGLRHGFGTMNFSDGDKYIGDWYKDNRSGYGKYFWTNGDTYEGEWLNGKLNGLGTYTWANGEIYTGEWENGEMVITQTTTQSTTTATSEALLDGIYQNQLLGRTANVIKTARAAESNINAKIDDLIARGGMYSSMMETYKNQLTAIQTDIANLNLLLSLIENAESNEELLEYEKTLISFESVY